LINKFKYIFCVVGILFISAGLIGFSFSNKNEREDTVDIIVDTSQKEGDTIDSSGYEFVRQTDLSRTISFRGINLQTKNLYSFSYPSSFKKYNLSDRSVYLIGENSYISAESFTVEDYDIYRQEILTNYEKSGFEKINVSYSNKKQKIWGYDMDYLKIEALGDIQTLGSKETIYREEFIVILKETENDIVTFSYVVTNSRLADEELTNLLRNIKVENGKAKFLYSRMEDEYLVGTLKTKSYVNGKDNSYFLSYKIPSSIYQEIENENNDVFTTTFGLKEDSSVIISIALQLGYLENYVENNISDLKTRFQNSNDFILESFEQENSFFQDKKLIKVDLTYSVVNEEQIKRHVLYVLVPLENFAYYTVNIDSDSAIPFDMMETFLNIKFEKLN